MKKTGQKFLCMMICLVLLLQLLPATAFAAEVASGVSGSAVWTLDGDGVFTISGGEMENYTSAAEQPWASYANQIKKAVIGNGIVRLGDYAFANCVNLTEVSIGSDVTTIGICAFENTTSLTEAVMPKNVKVFCDGMFHNSGIKKLYVLSRYSEFEGFYSIGSDDDSVLPLDTVIYCYDCSHAYFYFNREDVLLTDDQAMQTTNADGALALGMEFPHYVRDLWRAAENKDALVIDSSIYINTEDAMRIHNEMVAEGKKIGPDYYNNGRLSVEVRIELRDYMENGITTVWAGADYFFHEKDLEYQPNEDYLQWGCWSNEESIVTVTPSAGGVTVDLNTNMKELSELAGEQVSNVFIYISVSGISYKYNGRYETQDKDTTIESTGGYIYDAHLREDWAEYDWLYTLDKVITVEDYAPWEGYIPAAEYAKYYEPVDRHYEWYYRISREGYFYDEEKEEDIYPGMDFWDMEEGMFTETYNGVLYGGVAGTYDAGDDASVTIREMLPAEQLAFVETLKGVKARGLGGEAVINLYYTLTLTFADGSVVVLEGEAADEGCSFLGICLHTCTVCEMCTSEELLACNSDYGNRTNECTCDTPAPAIVSSAVNDAVVEECNSWAGELTARVETFDVEMAVTTDYFKAIVNSIGSSNVAAVFDITLFNEWGEPYVINEWGGTEEYVTLTIPVSAAIMEAAVNGELELYHVDKNGIPETVAFTVDAANNTLTFTGFSFSPYVLVEIAQPYGRKALSQLPNGEALVYAYDQIVEGIENTVANISVDNGVDSLSVEDIHTVWSAYNQDHGGVFWRGNGYSYSYNSSGVTAVLPTYIFTGAELEEKKAEMEAKVAEILAGITPGMGEYEKALYLHDRLAAIVTYVDGPNAHNAYGALVEGKAVCEGYAEAYQYLLQQVGIQSHNIIGSSYNAGTGAYEGHEWTCARIDGKYYHIDVTWDDQGEVLFHAYFGLSDARIQEDHVIEVPAYDLPVCDSGEALYFRGKPELLETYTVASVAELLQDNGGTVHVYIPGNVQTFIDWYYANIYAIATQMGLNGFQSRLQYLGREIVLTLKAPQPAYTPGDINGDDKINNKDASRLFQYLAGWDVEVNEAALDVNGDGKVNNKDASRLFQYLAGWDVEIH